MPVRSLTATSFFVSEFVWPGCLVPATLPWVLARFRSTWFPGWLFVEWRPWSTRSKGLAGGDPGDRCAAPLVRARHESASGGAPGGDRHDLARRAGTVARHIDTE